MAIIADEQLAMIHVQEQLHDHLEKQGVQSEFVNNLRQTLDGLDAGFFREFRIFFSSEGLFTWTWKILYKTDLSGLECYVIWSSDKNWRENIFRSLLEVWLGVDAAHKNLANAQFFFLGQRPLKSNWTTLAP